LLKIAALFCQNRTSLTLPMPSSASPALHFDRVSKRYGQAYALREFSLQIAAGQTFGLVGMNGAGKTTLLKCLLDFCQPDAGTIELFGVSNQITAARAPLAFLPERFNPPFYLTGSDFVRYMLQLHGVGYVAPEVERTFAELDLDRSALDKPVRAFSKGMTQKLGLAACFLARTDLYLLDEPTSGLDPKARALLKQKLRAIRAAGHTIFFTSHALADVEELCDSMAVIHQGELRFSGTPAELRAAYGSGSLEDAFLACIDSEMAASV
jgi:ABC-2 type transport system ATP-binding protein